MFRICVKFRIMLKSSFKTKNLYFSIMFNFSHCDVFNANNDIIIKIVFDDLYINNAI